MADKVHFYGTGESGNQGIQSLYGFHCIGCGYSHGYHVPRWDWNGSLDKPTFRPSLMCNRDTPYQCHLYVTDGKIEYQQDCHHELKGQTLEMVDWDDN